MKFFTKQILLFTLFFSVISSVAAQSENEDEIIVETSLVVIPAKVTDRSDKNIPDLKKEDFRIFEDGVEQEITGFEDSFAPFTIALAIDISDSTRFQLTDIKRTAIAFFKQLRPDDQMIVYTFDNNLYKIADVKNNSIGNAQDSIKLTATGGKSAVYDAVGKIIGADLRKVTGKKALIIFTDGVDTDSKKESFESSLRSAQESGVLIFPIQYNTMEDERKKFGPNAQLLTSKGESLSDAYLRATRYLQSLSGNSGGDFFYVDSVANLEKNFSKIAKQLGQIYSLSYYQPDNISEKKRKIKVEVKNPQAIVRTRKNYYLSREKSKKK